MPSLTNGNPSYTNGAGPELKESGATSFDALGAGRQSYDQLAQNGGSSEHSNERSYHPPPSSFSKPKQSTTNGKTENDLPDFFSQEVFRIVLHNPATAHRLLKFTQARMCGENMEFLEKVDRYNALLDELTTILTDIHNSYTSEEAPKQIGSPETMLKKLNGEIKTCTTSTLPYMGSLFEESQANVENILKTAVYPRFVKYQMTKSASQALSGDRQNYQGLGDCFCLTDPARADNPIVYASDGFVGVTGYTRPEVMPRNCRFLQGNQTDRTAVRRLKDSIDTKEETVELLLNYKKTGEPFWNLLYVAPLYDSSGKLAFYIGGQINCSTTIRSNTDVLRILSASDEVEDNGQKSTQPQRPSKRGIFGFARRSSMKRIPQTVPKSEVQEPGMEQGLLKSIEKLNFRTQMEKFYTAYSKYIVVKLGDMDIMHYSRGMADILDVSAAESDVHFFGVNIFKLLAQHAPSVPREFKSKVKDALKHGQAISAGLELFTSQTPFDERFLTHWTPCKDENGRVRYAVMTLSSSSYA